MRSLIAIVGTIWLGMICAPAQAGWYQVLPSRPVDEPDPDKKDLNETINIPDPLPQNFQGDAYFSTVVSPNDPNNWVEVSARSWAKTTLAQGQSLTGGGVSAEVQWRRRWKWTPSEGKNEETDPPTPHRVRHHYTLTGRISGVATGNGRIYGVNTTLLAVPGQSYTSVPAVDIYPGANYDQPISITGASFEIGQDGMTPTYNTPNVEFWARLSSSSSIQSGSANGPPQIPSTATASSGGSEEDAANRAQSTTLALLPVEP